jgi:membrane protein DedA with SNARE-associated domain
MIDLRDQVRGIVEAFGYLGLVLLLVLENLFPPIPSEMILPWAGFLSAQGQFHYLGVVGAATAGSTVGALILYGIARSLGERRVRQWLERHGAVLLVRPDDYARAKAWFDRHQGRAVFLARIAPAARSFISIPAGIARMPVPQFVLATALGSGLWNASLVGAGWLLGAHWDQVSPYVGTGSWLVIGLALALFLWFQRKRAIWASCSCSCSKTSSRPFPPR